MAPHGLVDGRHQLAVFLLHAPPATTPRKHVASVYPNAGKACDLTCLPHCYLQGSFSQYSTVSRPPGIVAFEDIRRPWDRDKGPRRHTSCSG